MTLLIFIALLGLGGLFSAVSYYSRVADKKSLQGWRETSWIASLAALIPFFLGLRFFLEWGTMALSYFLLSCLYLIPFGITLYADWLRYAASKQADKTEDSDPENFP